MRTLCMNKDEVHLDVYYMMPWGEWFFSYPLNCVICLDQVCSRLCPHRSTHYTGRCLSSQLTADEYQYSYCIHKSLQNPVLLGAHRNLWGKR